MIAILDTDYRIIRANRAMADALKVLPQEALGLTCYQHLHGVGAPPDTCPHRQLLADGLAHSAERYEERLGGWVQMSATPLTDGEGHLIGSVHVAHDITERKRTEEALRQSEATFKALADTSPLAIFLSEGSERRAEYLNPMFIRLFGYTLEEVPTAEHWYPLAYPDATYRLQIMTEWQRRIAVALETGSEIDPMESVVTCKG